LVNFSGRITVRYARAIAVNKKIVNRSTAGFGSLRKTFHTTMLIDSILRAGESANESVGRTRRYNSGIGTKYSGW